MLLKFLLLKATVRKRRNNMRNLEIKRENEFKINNEEEARKILFDRAQNIKIRILAMKYLRNNQADIIKIALTTDELEPIRGIAFWYIKDQAILEKIALTEKDSFARKRATSWVRNQEVLSKIALTDEDPEVRANAVWNCNEQDTLIAVVLNDENWIVRLRATQKIKDQEKLKSIALIDESNSVRRTAANALTCNNVIYQLALVTTDYDVSKIVAAKLTDKEMLVEIAKKAKGWKARDFAKEKYETLCLK